VALSRQQQEDQADQELADKHALEIQFLPLLQRLYLQIGNDLQQAYEDFGNTINAYTYKSDFQRFFTNLYQVTSITFQTSLESQLDENNETINQFVAAGGPLGAQSPQDFIDELNARSALSINQFIGTQSTTQTNQVTDTNQKNISDALAFAIALSIANNLTRRQTAQALKDKFMELANARTGTILATSVQNGSEGTKNIIAGEYNKMARGITGNTNNLSKIWLTRQDDRVRLSHREADFQTVNYDEPFTVQNQLLNYPGDISLGATASNVINCRCVMILLLN
jgi:uncharacterized protein with gpF-like domain